MLRNKDPEGYVGDDAVTWATNEVIKRLRQESKLTDEEIAANMKKVGVDPTFRLLHRGFALRLRSIRENSGMSRMQLANASNLPVRLISAIERGALKNILMGDMLRLCLGLKYDVVKFMQEVYVEAERLVEAGSS
jgi:DNA-binding transcriptional regulator YiaG